MTLLTRCDIAEVREAKSVGGIMARVGRGNNWISMGKTREADIVVRTFLRAAGFACAG